MKNLDKILNYRTFFASTSIIGITMVGVGVYNLREKDSEKGRQQIAFGALISLFGSGYFIGREHEKKANKKNYQTKPEDYQIK